MRTFEEYLAEGGSTADATLFEKLIVIAYNGGTDEQLEALGVSREKYEENKEAAEKIAKNIRKTTRAKSGDMIHFGAGKGKTISWWLGDPTPKTDMYTSGGVNISLKKFNSGSQLMSGLGNETKSTFRAVQEYMTEKNQGDINNLIDLITPVVYTKLQVPGNVDALTDYFKTKVVPKQVTGRRGKNKVTVDIDPEEFLQAAKIMQATTKQFSAITKELNAWFSTNPDTKLWFTYEAATGETKFQPDAKARSNWIVEFDPKGDSRVELISAGHASPTPFIEKIAKKVKVSARFKTGSGSTIQASGLSVPRSFSFRIDVAAPKKGETIFDDVQVAFSKFSNQTLNEAREKFGDTLLTEGITQKVSDFFRTKIKTWLQKIASWLVEKIKQVATHGYRVLLDYLGIKVDKVDVSGLEMFGF